MGSVHPCILAGDRAPGSDGFPLAFFFSLFPAFLVSALGEDVLAFMEELYMRGRLSNGLEAAFIAFVAKKTWLNNI